MSKVDDIVASGTDGPKQAFGRVLASVDENGRFMLEESQEWASFVERQHVHALIAWLVENYGLPDGLEAVQDLVDQARDDAARDAEERR